MPVQTNAHAVSYRQSLLIFAAIVAVFLTALAVALLSPTPLHGLERSSVLRLDAGWFYYPEGERQAIATLPHKIDGAGDELTLEHDLSGLSIRPDYVLTFRTRYASISAYADDTLIYRSPQGEEHALGSMWHFIPLSRCTGAETLTVVLRGYDGGSYTLDSVLMDTPGAIKFFLLRENSGAIVFSFICILLTAALILIAAILARWQSQMHLPLLSLAAFIFLSGLWILLDSKVTTVSGGNYALSYFFSYAAFYVLPAPYLLYIRLTLKDCRRALDILIWALIANAVVCMVLHLFGVVPLRRTAIIVHALIVLSVPATVCAFWRSVIRRKDKQLFFTFAGSLVIYFCALVSIALYYFGILHIASSTPFYIVGLSILLIGMTADIVASFGRFWHQKETSEQYRQMAVEDGMTALGNRNAFLLHMTQLLKSQPRQLAFIMIDIDDLKLINDQMGHHFGDIAIHIAAACIRSAFGPIGHCYRIGGDEFVVVVTGEAVEKIPERVTRFEQEMLFRWDNSLPSNGVSYGYASAEFSHDSPLTELRLTELQEQADQALYLHKQSRKVVTESNMP